MPARWKPNSTPLHIAAARGSTTMVKHMLQAYVSERAYPPESIFRIHQVLDRYDLSNGEGRCRC